jgi:carboxypeptidase Taq
VKELPGLETEIGNGRTQSLLQWLRQGVHRHGKALTSNGLCRQLTGKPLETEFFMNHILEKYRTIYNLYP